MTGIRECFISRFEGGQIIEGDLSQIEVVGQAWLSGDEQMKDDVREGIDFHCKRLAYKEGISYEEAVNLCESDREWQAKRKKVKPVSFQKAYGASAKSISISTGLPLEEVKKLLEAEDALYPSIQEFNESNLEEVQRNRKVTSARTERGGYPIGVGYLVSPTGRRYVFTESESPEFVIEKGGDPTSFDPPKIKNYPIQGFCGDILKTILGKLFRVMREKKHWRGNVLLINTVHDSIMLDSKPEYVEEAKQVIKEVMEDAAYYLWEWFNIDFDLPIRAEVASGPNWAATE